MSHWLIVSGDLVAHGGMDRANLELARYLSQCGKVDVVAHRLDETLAQCNSVSFKPCQRPFNANILGEQSLRRLAVSTARNLGDGVRSITNGGCAPLSDVNWVHYVHAAYKPGFSGRSWRTIKNAMHYRRCLRWEKDALQRAAVVICNSHLTARHIHELVGVPNDKIRVVYYGCDANVYKPISLSERTAVRRSLNWDDRPSAIFIGGLGDRRKGFDLLYEAWKALCQNSDWDACLRVVGRGSDLAQWQRCAARDGLSDRIEFLGFRSDVDRLLSASDVLIHPARYEAYGLGVHEALCSGVPAILSSDAGIAERYPPECRGLLIDDLKSSEPLRELIFRWRQDVEMWREQVRHFSESLRERSWQIMAQDFIKAVSE